MKNYEALSDEQLIELLRKGESGPEEYLVKKYKGMVLKKAHAMFLIGGEQEDLIQEGMLGLFKAIQGYQAGKNASFSTFANLCVERQMGKAIEISGRQKHRPLNTYISLSQEDGPLMNTEDTIQLNPEEIVIGRENADNLSKRIQKVLSPFENQVLDLYLQGMDYRKIAEKIGKPAKSVDNALQRIRSKIHGMKEHQR